jgi:hypothetical protein
MSALAILLVIIAAFAFGYYTGRDHARDQAAFDNVRKRRRP